MLILIQFWFLKQGLIVLGSQRQKPENGNLEQYKSLFFYVCLIFSIFLVTSVWSWPIPDSGQDKCYDDQGNVIECPQPGEPFYGQDANYSINPRSYTKLDAQGNALPDNATEWVMVKDNVTGLIWEVKTDDGGIHDKDDKYTFGDAKSKFIAELNKQSFGGHSDWRMPTIKGLDSIVNLGKNDSSIDTYYFMNTQSLSYWSAYGDCHEGNYAWKTSFYYGYISNFYRSNSHNVRAVRSVLPVSDHKLIENDDGTVTDPNTGLQWQQLTKKKEMSWKEALEYCENLTLASHNDWRLPNKKELHSIVNYSTYSPAINTQLFPGTYNTDYLSSTVFPNSETNIWCVDFHGGYNKPDGKFTRAVRGG